jgi:SAM-dependent methyltransferase
MNYSEVVQTLVRVAGYRTYLELGIWDGDTFAAMNRIVPRCIGVDIQDRRKEKVGEFYLESTDDFFAHWTDPVDAVFIDACHYFHHVRRDFENSLRVLAPRGLILLHDTDPRSPEFLEPDRCATAYLIVPYIRLYHPELDVLTLQTADAGLSLVRRKTDLRVRSLVTYPLLS